MADRPSAVVGTSKPRLWKILGPGLITGAADDDPSGIATYSQAGAQFGFGLAWITSAAQAAEGLRPIAGRLAFALIMLGIVGTGILSVPVLAGSAAYAMGAARRWPVGLTRQPRHFTVPSRSLPCWAREPMRFRSVR